MHATNSNSRTEEILDGFSRDSKERSFTRSTLKSTGNETCARRLRRPRYGFSSSPTGTVHRATISSGRGGSGAFNRNVRNYESLFDYVGREKDGLLRFQREKDLSAISLFPFSFFPREFYRKTLYSNRLLNSKNLKRLEASWRRGMDWKETSPRNWSVQVFPLRREVHTRALLSKLPLRSIFKITSKLSSSSLINLLRVASIYI